jgi:hypothetical protein
MPSRERDDGKGLTVGKKKVQRFTVHGSTVEKELLKVLWLNGYVCRA